MSDIINYKKLSLFVILDAYVTKNGILDFLSRDHSEFKELMIEKDSKYKVEIDKYIADLNQELEDIEEFLNDKNNEYFLLLNLNREFFDNNLPYHKRKIQWFKSINRYPFNYSVFYKSLVELM